MKLRAVILFLLGCLAHYVAYSQTICAPSRASVIQPVIIIDSVLNDNSSLQTVNPDDINSITVLKGSNAVAIARKYGKDGKPGVVIIETKNQKNYKLLREALADRNFTILPSMVFMVDDVFVRNIDRYRIDPTKIEAVFTVGSGFEYLSPEYRNLQIIKIATQSLKEALSGVKK